MGTLSSPANQLTSVNTIADTNQTSAQLNALERIVLQNENLIGELEKRLHPILRSRPPASPDATGKPEEYLVPLADALRNVSNAALRCELQLEDILSRAEI